VSKIIPFLFAVVLIWQGLGTFVVFQLERKAIRKELKMRIKEGVPEGELSEFRFTSDQYHQLEWRKSNEFVWQGHFFDVVKSRKDVNGNFILKCISDRQEDKLFADLGNSIATYLDKKHSKSSAVNWEKLTNILFVSNIGPILNIPRGFDKQPHLFAYSCTPCAEYCARIDKPPISQASISFSGQSVVLTYF